ncbi:TonB-dependent receptor SusC [termite gut metagenome]|uniref:TonB-dependent receptor SusC n=1 Tax=termite gut metagenome TaxID=433724 RepID=A0A5J4S872_9ZZZZ
MKIVSLLLRKIVNQQFLKVCMIASVCLCFLLVGVEPAWGQQQITVRGKVTDRAGAEIIGANIIEKGTQNGTVTDVNGEFSLNVQAGKVLIISYIGYDSKEVQVAARLNVELDEDAQALSEVVVVGYGVQRKSDITGAVSSIKTGEAIKRPITRFEQILQGTTPGVQVVSNSGQPGKGLSVKIRGASSITGGTDPLYVIDGNIGGGIEALNPNDIASIEILKDASSTAIYGSRGTNGVVMITTKSGDPGKPKISYNTWWANTNVPKYLDVMSAADFARIINDKYKSGAYNDQIISELERTGGSNWAKEMSRSAWTQNHDINISGGTEAVKYRVSFNMLDQPGLIVNQWYKKSNVRANLDTKINNRLDLKFILSYIESKNRNAQFSGDIYDPFSQAYYYDPTFPIYDANGNYTTGEAPYGALGVNPLGSIMDMKEDRGGKSVEGTGVLTYKLLDGLTFTSNNTYASGSYFDQAWRGKYSQEAKEGGTRAEINSGTWTSFRSSNFLTYDKVFADHHITATLLYERNHYERLTQKGLARRLSTEALSYYNLSLGSAFDVGSGYNSDAMESYMGRVNYSYKDRYLLTASLRRDGSSHLTEKWDNFPAIAAAWNIANESFLDNHPWIQALKLRASYGETGNQSVDAYSTIAQVTTGGGYYFFDGITPITTTGLGTTVSTKVGWEHAKQTDIGLDMVLLNGRLSLNIDVYNKNVTGLLYNFPAPAYMGGGTYLRNMGEINNKGLEIMVSGIPVNHKDFSWNSYLTLGFNKNKVVDLMGEDNIPYNGIGTFGAGVSRLMVGHSLGDFWGWKFQGTWKSSEAAEAAKYNAQPGDAKFLDRDSNSAINDDDKMVIGNGTPDLTYGFINDLRYKDFSLSIMFQGMSGNDIFSQTMGLLWGGHGIQRHAVTKDATNAWTPQNETDIPVLNRWDGNKFASSRFVYDGSFVKLKNISLTYSVPKPFLSKCYVSNLEVYVSGQNLLTFTKYPGMDPEVNSSTNAATQGLEMGLIPNPKMYTLGLRIGF